MKFQIVSIVIWMVACSQISPANAVADSPADMAQASIQNYFKAWGQRDDEKRAELLKTAWAENGIYSDPSAHVVGRQALIKHIGQALASPQFQGASLSPGSAVDIHHQVFRFEWKMSDASGKTLIKGMDYGEFNEQGQITKIIGFFGPFPKLK